MQIFFNGMNYIGQARQVMIMRLYSEGRRTGCIPLIEAVRRCREIELVIRPDGKKETHVKG